MGILALIAEFETEIRRERQMEGIAKAKAKAEGRTGGRPRLVTDEVRSTMVGLRSEGQSIRAIAAEVGLSKATVQKTLEAARGQT